MAAPAAYRCSQARTRTCTTAVTRRLPTEPPGKATPLLFFKIQLRDLPLCPLCLHPTSRAAQSSRPFPALPASNVRHSHLRSCLTPFSGWELLERGMGLDSSVSPGPAKQWEAVGTAKYLEQINEGTPSVHAPFALQIVGLGVGVGQRWLGI